MNSNHEMKDSNKVEEFSAAILVLVFYLRMKYLHEMENSFVFNSNKMLKDDN